MSQNKLDLGAEGVFRIVFRKTGIDDVTRAKDAVRANNGLLVIVEDVGYKDRLIAGTVVCYEDNHEAYALELFDGKTANFELRNLSRMYI